MFSHRFSRISTDLYIEPPLQLFQKSVSIRGQKNYVLSGHIHPVVQLKGKSRQSMKLPCFYFGKREGILPAFCQFTGTHVIEPKKGDRVYTIAESQILSINAN